MTQHGQELDLVTACLNGFVLGSCESIGADRGGAEEEAVVPQGQQHLRGLPITREPRQA
jgi:hypothetical protein